MPSEDTNNPRPWTVEEDRIFESVSRKGAHKVSWALVEHAMCDSGFPRTIPQLKLRRQHLDLQPEEPVPEEWTSREDDHLRSVCERVPNSVPWRTTRARMRKFGSRRSIPDLIARANHLGLFPPQPDSPSQPAPSPEEQHNLIFVPPREDDAVEELPRPVKRKKLQDLPQLDPENPLLYRPPHLAVLDKHGRPPSLKFVTTEDNLIRRCLRRRKILEERWDHVSQHLADYGFVRTAYACQHRTQKLCELSQATYDAAKLAGKPLPDLLEMPNGPLRKRPRSASGIQQHRWTDGEELTLKKCLAYRETNYSSWQVVAEWMTTAGFPRTSSAVQQRAKRIREQADNSGVPWPEFIKEFYCETLPVAEERSSEDPEDGSDSSDTDDSVRKMPTVKGSISSDMSSEDESLGEGMSEAEDDDELPIGGKGTSHSNATEDDEESSDTRPSIEAVRSAAGTPEQEVRSEDVMAISLRGDSADLPNAKPSSSTDVTMKETGNDSKHNVDSDASQVKVGRDETAAPNSTNGYLEKAIAKGRNVDLKNSKPEKALRMQGDCEAQVPRSESNASKKADPSSLGMGIKKDTLQRGESSGKVVEYSRESGLRASEREKEGAGESEDDGMKNQSETRAPNHARIVLNFPGNEVSGGNAKEAGGKAGPRRSKRSGSKLSKQVKVVESGNKGAAITGSGSEETSGLGARSVSKTRRKAIQDDNVVEEPSMNVEKMKPFYESLSDSDNESSLGDVPIRGALGEIPSFE